MHRLILLTLFILLTRNTVFAQTIDTAWTDYKYVVDTEDYFKPYKDARLIIDYHHSEGISWGDRFTYEIIMVDSQLMVAFESPETDTYHYISYRKNTILSPEKVDSIKALLKKSGVKKIKAGIPTPQFSANITDVLIVRQGNSEIRGGVAHGIVMEEMTPEKEAAEIAEERARSTSLGGDYEGVFNMIRGLVPDLPNLLKEVYQNY